MIKEQGLLSLKLCKQKRNNQVKLKFMMDHFDKNYSILMSFSFALFWTRRKLKPLLTSLNIL